MILIFLIIILVILSLILLIKNIKFKDKYIDYDNNINDIPKIIHKILIQDKNVINTDTNTDTDTNTELDKNVKFALNSWEKMNKNYIIKHWNLNSIREYLKKLDSNLLYYFDKIKAYAGKADFFRYIIIYNEGGWYSDFKQVCLQNGILDKLNNSKRSNIVLFKEAYLANYTDNIFNLFNYKNNFCILNSFFGAVKHNIILNEAIYMCIHNIKNEIYKNNFLSMLGPCLLKDVIKKLKINPSILSGYAYFHFLPEPNLYIKSYKFGKIIQHKCSGCGLTANWKNGNNYKSLWKNKTFYNNY